MVRPNLKFTWIADRKARKAAYKQRTQGLMKKADELTILCNMSACLIFFSHDDDKLVVWPSQEEAESLIERYNALPGTKRNTKAEDQESYIKTNIKKIEKKLAHGREVIAELEMDHLMFQLQNGRSLNDLSQTEIDSLISYASKKITCLRKELGCTEHPLASPMGMGSANLMDKWLFADPKVQKHGVESHLTTMTSRFDLNMEPSDDDEEDVESSKSGGADDS